VDRPQRGEPVVVGQEDLRDVARHHREVRVDRGDGSRAGAEPPDAIGVRLPASYIERSGRRIDRHDVETAPCEEAGQRPRAAADVEHAARTQLLDQRRVHLEVGSARLQDVVQLGEPGIGEEGVRHAS
jgi:hypothetical protein